MLKSVFAVALLVAVLFTSSLATAKEIPVQGRLFIGMLGVDPKNTNETLQADGLKKFESINRMGIDITYPLYKYLDVGMRYTKRLGEVEEEPASSATDYKARIDQDSIMFLARVPFYQTDIIKLDAFAGVGGSNTTMTVKTGSMEGEYTRKESGDWVATPIAAAGMSFAIGYKQFYFVVEGGIESNKVDSLKRSGTTSAAIDTLDLSGSYFSVGLLFDGVPGTVGK